MDAGSSPDVFLFEQFRFDRRGGGVSRRTEDGKFLPITLGSRALAVLGVLVERPGDLVSKDEIMRAVWPGTTVEDANLTMQISALRRALDAGRARSSCILNVPGRGYRFLPEVTRLADRSGLPLPDKPSIAVLPFANLSDNPEEEYFADGLVEEIITGLSRVRSFFVIARNSSLTYKGRTVDVKQVGRDLGVRYLLEGSVRKASGRIRITGQLIDATTGTQLWAERFEGALADVFELQDRVTIGVVGVIEPTIRSAEIERAQRKPTGDLRAYDLVLRGLPLMRGSSRERMEEGIHLFRRATEIDPNYALAFALLSFWSYHRLVQGWLVPAQVDLKEIVRHARIALELDGNDPEVLALSAYSIAAPGGDLNGAIALTEKALTLNPNSVVALTISARWHAEAGNTEKAIERLERAARLNPLEGNSLRNNVTSVAYFHAGQYETAIAFARKALADSPNAVAPMRRLAALLGLLGRIEEAREVVRRLRVICPEMTISRLRAYYAVESPGGENTRPIHDAIYEGLRRAGFPE